MKGGLTEVYRVLWSKKANEKEKMFQLDRNAAYCYIAMTETFPIGQYKVYSSYDLDKIFFNGTNFCFANGKKIFGIVMIRILCPKDLDIPFMSYDSVKTQRTFRPCCKECVESNNTQKCHHTIG